MKDKISKLFVQAGGFRDLEVPEIIASGGLVIYYCNTERLLCDNGKWEDYGNNSLEMINHACNIERVFPEFREVIDAIVEIVKPLLNLSEKVAISGGQRRDWIFSGPVARRLKVPHISVYKNGEIEIHEDTHLINRDIEGFKALHICDLVTKASSAYSVSANIENGCIPILREKGVVVKDLISVVDRLQGGRQNLERANVNLHSLVEINEAFLLQNSNQPLVAVEYFRQPQIWAEKYIVNQGINNFVDYFDPNGSKVERAHKFVEVYSKALRETIRFGELKEKVKERFGIDLS